MWRLLVIGVCALLAACAPKAYERRVAFNEDEYQPYSGGGTGGIDVQAFLRTEAGQVMPAAGHKIFCEPVTSYSTEYFQRTILGTELIRSWDEACLKYVQAKLGDAEGRAKFRNLAPGKYYIYSHIWWKAYDSNKYVGVYDYNTGGVAHAIVEVKDGEVSEAVATR